MARWLALIALAGIVVACGSSPAGNPPAGPAGPGSSAGPESSVIAGTVSAGPNSPVARPGQRSSRPVPGVRVEAMRGGRVQLVRYTDHDGRFSFTVRPGTYVIVIRPVGFRFARPQPKTVTAVAGGEQQVDFLLDTGIR